MEYLSIDRLEGGFAVCEREDRTTVRIPLAELPSGVVEGDCLRSSGGGYIVDSDETHRRRAEILSLHAKLLRKEKQS